MKNVQIYTTPTCQYCKMAKEFFGEHNVKYTEYNVSSDPTRREEMMAKSGQRGVPVIFVDNEMVIGFDEDRLRSLLGV